MKRMLPILLLLCILLTGCSYTQEEYNEAKETAYDEGYYAAIHEASIGEIDEARHPEIVEYVIHNYWKEIFDYLMEDDPAFIYDYLEQYESINLDDVTFIANTASHVYHLKDCSHVANISEENILYWSDSEEALSQAGYYPCSDCLPPSNESGETTSEGTPITHEYDMDNVDWVDTPDSSTFTRIGYDSAEEDLLVEFHNSGIYVYHFVPEQVWDDLNTAESKGSYYNAEIKGSYDCEKLDLDETA